MGRRHRQSQTATTSGDEVNRQGAKDAAWISRVSGLAGWGCASGYLLEAPGSMLGKILFFIPESAGDSYFNGEM